MRAWRLFVSGCLVSVWSCSADPSVLVPRDRQVQRTSEAFSFTRLEKVDLLFVVDNSNSMAGEQALLRAQFPRLMEALTTGQRSPDDPRPFTPVRDMHVGVVSVDMGIPGVELPPSCHADGGDDGRLQNTGRGTPELACAASYPMFLDYQAGSSDPAQLANDFACVANLGTGGCGFEQQLESPLKALTPRWQLNAEAQLDSTPPLRFVATEEARTWGRGDLAAVQGGNAGFVRNTPDEPSLLVIVLLTDEEDCSVKSTEHLRPNNQLADGDPLRQEDVNLRCVNHPEFLYDLSERYLKGFRALRPGREDLVVFSAIVGVPVDLVSAQVMAQTDLADEASRKAFYDNILSDPRMQQVVDPASFPGTGQGNLLPSCSREVPGEAAVSTAFPPRRIVELARAFGPNGMVQSICQDDFGPAVDMLVNSMAKPLSEMCMPQQLVRRDDDRVSCTLYFELPTPEERERQMLDAATPTDCSALGSLLDPNVPAGQSASGGQRCAIQQLAVQDDVVPDGGDGWYYDDFTQSLDAACADGLTQRIAFSASARPPRGVGVKLECEAGARETQ